MGTPHDPDETQLRQRLEELGPAQVRLLMNNGGWAHSLHPFTLKWLAEKDQEAARLKDASQSEQIEIARSAKNAAWEAAAAAKRASDAAERQATAAERANTRATIALIIAIISIIVTAISILLVHWDATHH